MESIESDDSIDHHCTSNQFSFHTAATDCIQLRMERRKQ